MTPERHAQIKELQALIGRLRDYAKSLDVTERPALGEYDLTKDIYDATGLLAVLDSGCESAVQETERLRAVNQKLFNALRAMSEWWAYAMDKPPGAEPSADDHKTVEQLVTDAIHALHAADPSYVHRLPGGAH